MSENPDEDDEGFALVMPFIVCTSTGGPYDDASYAAGAELGTLDSELAVASTVNAVPGQRYVRTANIPQLDLIAMHRGYTITQHDVSHEWTRISFDWSPSE